jgi:hypothetical protein
MPKQLLLLLIPLVLFSFGCKSEEEARPSQTQTIYDDQPMEYASVAEAAASLPKRSDVETVEQVAPGLIGYVTGRDHRTHWWVFGKGHPFYPSVVRRRIVDIDTRGGYVVKTAKLCESTPAQCEALRAFLAKIDANKSSDY